LEKAAEHGAQRSVKIKTTWDSPDGYESRAGHAALAASSLPQAIENFCRTDPAFELQE
jgi:hypothetical protein